MATRSGSRSGRKRRTRVARGTLSTDQIVDATLSLIRDTPDEPITMERVAQVLGTRPMSLYTHVRSRDEMLSLAAQQVLSGWDAAVPAKASWEEQLRAWCMSLADHVREYRPLVLEMTSSGTFQPALVHEVVGLARILREAGLSGPGLVAAIRWIPQTVLGAVVLELSRPEGLQSVNQEAAAVHGAMSGLTEEDRAEVADLLPHFTEADLPDLFGYTLDRLVDGVRAAAAGGD